MLSLTASLAALQSCSLANFHASVAYVPALVCVVPLRSSRLVRLTGVGLSTPLAVPVAVCATPLYVTLYGVTTITAFALAMLSLTVPLVALDRLWPRITYTYFAYSYAFV